jgi:hypothetical protein
MQPPTISCGPKIAEQSLLMPKTVRPQRENETSRFGNTAGGSDECPSKTVWRKGWQREAVATQAASKELAAFIGWLEQRGYQDSADMLRRMAMQHGVRSAEADLRAALLAKLSNPSALTARSRRCKTSR